MRIVIASVAALSTAVGAVLVDTTRSTGLDGSESRVPSHYTVRASQPEGADLPTASAMDRLERSIKLEAGTKRPVGEFELSDGRKLRLLTAETRDARSCLIDDDENVGAGASCLDGGLFAARRVAFSVNSQGGPHRFTELYVTGVVAPDVRAVSLGRTDGSSLEVPLTSRRAFLFESSATDLERGVHPRDLRLYGRSGRLVETVTFPPVG